MGHAGHGRGEDARARVGDAADVVARVGPEETGFIGGGQDRLDLGRGDMEEAQVRQKEPGVRGVQGAGDDDAAVAAKCELGQPGQLIAGRHESAFVGDAQDQLVGADLDRVLRGRGWA